jgi:exosortase
MLKYGGGNSLETPAYSSGLNAAPSAGSPAPAAPKEIPWASLIWFGLLLIGLFFQTVYDMAGEWFTTEEMGHGVFAPVIAGYVIWQNREELLRTKLNPSWAGLALVVAGFLCMIVGIRGADFFISRMGFWISLVGAVWTLGGTNLLRAVWFPLFILLFMIRIPLFIYTQITFPLQLLASRVAEVLLGFIGIPVLRDGNILELPSQKLSVVEACSGIRSLMSLSMLALVYGYLFDSKSWMRWVLLALAAPIAIAANGLRVTLTGVMSEVNTEMASGIYHSVEGFVMWGVALTALVLAHQAVNAGYRRWFAGRPAQPA